MTQQQACTPHLSHSPDAVNTEEGRLSQDFDERFLLTPPAAETATMNPFDHTGSIGVDLESSSTLSRLLAQNYRSHQQNGSLQDSHAFTGGVDAAGGLVDLKLNTDTSDLRRTSSVGSSESFPELKLRSSTSAGSIPLRIPSVRHRLHSSAGSISPGSVISSPVIAAMLDITPLPSPTMGPGEWRSLAASRSRASSTASRTELGPPLIPTTSPRKKAYGSLRKSSLSDVLAQANAHRQSETRSTSEYIPDSLSPPKQRHVSESVENNSRIEQTGSELQREHYLGIRRGIAGSETRPITPSKAPSSWQNDPSTIKSFPKRTKVEVWSAESIHTGATKHYETIRMLGQGTFSKVFLAVRQMHDRKDSVDYREDSIDMAGVKARSRRLVAVKVVEPGPAGGADAERIGISLKREVELMKKIMHPSIIHLKAFGTEISGRALIVLNYCPGGDLFDVASKQLAVLTPPLVRRIFSELVSAVRFLHQKYIVHRDIKLENVLLNIPVQVHTDVDDWQTLDRAVVTLTDLGLSRSIPPPPESPLLETRCGSEDYAAPEIIMGQPYDGRQTDAWALGVLLYSLMEGRLPFDPAPGARGDPATLRARTPHRIARCEWQWVRYGDEDGDWDGAKGRDLDGARHCVDALLKRSTRRKPLADIRDWPWVKHGIVVDGGLRWVEEEV